MKVLVIKNSKIILELDDQKHKDEYAQEQLEKVLKDKLIISYEVIFKEGLDVETFVDFVNREFEGEITEVIQKINVIDKL